MPESCSLLLRPMSRCLRHEGFDMRAETSVSQLISDSLQPLSLDREENLMKHINEFWKKVI